MFIIIMALMSNKIATCNYTSRPYHVARINKVSNDIDPHLKLYSDIMNPFHFYLTHLHHDNDTLKF